VEVRESRRESPFSCKQQLVSFDWILLWGAGGREGEVMSR
jgi:hypothetical protein